jgi:hypothetical protein
MNEYDRTQGASADLTHLPPPAARDLTHLPPPAATQVMSAPPPPVAPPPAPPRTVTPPPFVTGFGSQSNGDTTDAINALPILDRREDSVWSEAEQQRDDIYAELQAVCRARDYEALLLKSNDGVHPAWVVIEAWIPKGAPDVTKRRRAEIFIDAREFHRYRFEYRVVLHDADWTREFVRLCAFTDKHAEMVAEFVLGSGKVPSALKGLEQRKKWWHFWKPHNKVDGLEVDPVNVATLGLGGLGGVLFFVGAGAKSSGAVLLGLLFLLALIPVRIIAKRRRAVVMSSGKPAVEPRNLLAVDSWQAMISGLGDDASRVRDELLSLIASSPIEGCHARLERIWYWSLDGKVERDQLVATLRRGIVFCHIYPYNEQLFVGWDAHLNRGQWVEKTLATGRGKTGEHTQLRTVVTGSERLNEYDIIDLSCLTEWMHRQLVTIIQRLMKERQIDQEIDFQIIRGDRDRVTGNLNPNTESVGEAARSATKRLGSRLARIG